MHDLWLLSALTELDMSIFYSRLLYRGCIRFDCWWLYEQSPYCSSPAHLIQTTFGMWDDLSVKSHVRRQRMVLSSIKTGAHKNRNANTCLTCKPSMFGGHTVSPGARWSLTFWPNWLGLDQIIKSSIPTKMWGHLWMLHGPGPHTFSCTWASGLLAEKVGLDFYWLPELPNCCCCCCCCWRRLYCEPFDWKTLSEMVRVDGNFTFLYCIYHLITRCSCSMIGQSLKGVGIHSK